VAASTAGRRPQGSSHDRTSADDADAGDHKQRPCREGRRGAAATQRPARRRADNREQNDDGGGREDGARWTVKLDGGLLNRS
jgi:hypothetical protein